jgi:hypothetical protein
MAASSAVPEAVEGLLLPWDCLDRLRPFEMTTMMALLARNELHSALLGLHFVLWAHDRLPRLSSLPYQSHRHGLYRFEKRGRWVLVRSESPQDKRVWCLPGCTQADVLAELALSSPPESQSAQLRLLTRSAPLAHSLESTRLLMVRSSLSARSRELPLLANLP